MFHLCKIAEAVDSELDSEITNEMPERYFRTKQRNKKWKIIDSFSVNEASDIFYWLRQFHSKNFAYEESEDGKALYVAVNRLKTSTDFNSQAKLLPLIFEHYKLEEDFCVRVNVTVCHEMRQIKTQITSKFYDALLLAHQIRSSSSSSSVEPEQSLNLPLSFLPTLCRYQERTVKWLLERELRPGQMRSYFMRLQAKDGITVVYKNQLCTEFFEQMPQDFTLPPGGILADEMGLGKTVELLALILLNKRQTPKDFFPLAEHVIPKKKLRIEIKANDVLCLCAKNNFRKRGVDLIQCQQCHLWQHRRCVSKHDDEHSSDINEPYICPGCWKNLSENKLIPSVATLIVTPFTIRLQWLNEIKRHILSDLRIYNYEGVMSKNWISPVQLADYDIVLTDYNILKREIYYTDEHVSDRVLRNKKKFLRPHTPLLMIEWWRCCLDEAQMVESDVSQMAALVRSIPAINRWAVSGTPIQRSIDDLYPLVRFLGLEHCINASAWTTLVRNFMQHCDDDCDENDVSSLRLVEILSNIMWRTAKQHVEDELPIPPQTEKVHHIMLSDLERLYYTEQHKECQKNFEETLRKYFKTSQLVVSTSHHLINIIMKPLLRIRMCCSIPTITAPRNQHVLTGVKQKQFLQPKELHAHLLLRNEKDCKSYLRSKASAYNGLAAIHFIKGEYLEAVNNYEAVLKLANEYADEKNISVDSLLQIHALFNILQARNFSSALEAKKEAKTFEAYETQLNDLEWKYLETYASQLYRVNQAFSKAKTTLLQNSEKTELNLLEFLSTLINGIKDDTNIQTQLLARILNECIRKFGSMRLEAASSLRGVLYIISTWFDKLEKAQSKIIAAFDELTFFTTNIKPRSEVSVQTWREVNNFINSVCDCHIIELRELYNESETENELTAPHNINRAQRQRAGKHVCKLCKLIDMINSYECLLFKKSIDTTTNVVEGDENPQLELEIIRIIFSFLKPKHPKMATDIENHFATLQSTQNFCKMAIKFWIEIEFTVKAYDELDMCKMRTTLTEDPAERNNYKIMRHELDLNFVRQEQNLKHAQHHFDLMYARLKYIKHLQADFEVGQCPICHSDEEKRHAFLACGHQVCLACFKFLTHISHGTKITCSLCRNEQPTESVYFVTSSNKIGELNQVLNVNGDYSAKITYIVKFLKQLISEHKATASSHDSFDLTSTNASNEKYPLKVLIFSQWTFVLNALAAALNENGITYCESTNVRSIEKFRNPDAGITCLLMPLSKGCKGLNLIEATHVFLVEPVLNVSEELQAIGRVHRFGQTRPTTVHRFIVDETVEENIHNLVSAGRDASQNCQFESITFENLHDLFTQVALL